MPSPLTNRLLLAFAVSTALLWVALVPLWDGFDEAQHYSYIQSLRQDRAWPVLGRTPITPEVWASFVGSPVSPAVKQNYPMLRTFSEARANAAPPLDLPPAGANYEAHQAPLVYLAMAPLEGTLARAGIPIGWRLRVLRLCLLACSMALFWRIAAGSPHRSAACFMILTTEMFLACCGHVANDAIAIPLFVWLFFEAERRSRLAVVLLAAGLLTKAYFLALVPVVVWRLRAQWRWFFAAGILPACWYGRNLWLYGNLSGMQEQTSPLAAGGLLRAALHLPWGASLGETFRGALWLGNNSFLQWSVWQANLVITGLLAALYVALRRNSVRRNGLIWLRRLLHWPRWPTRRSRPSSTPRAPASPPAPGTRRRSGCLSILVIFAGETPRRVLTCFVALWTYWFVATFWLRLIPWYAGVMDGPTNVVNLRRWYGASFGHVRHEIGDPVLILALAASLLAIVTAVSLCRDLRAGRDRPATLEQAS